MPDKTQPESSLANLVREMFESEQHDQYDRPYMVCNIAYWFGASIHCSWMLLFFLLGIRTLGLLNIFSTLLFGLLIWLNKRGYRPLTVTLAILEVVLHQVSAVILIGWNTGFQYYLVLVLMLPFLILRGHLWLNFALAFLATCSYLYLDFAWRQAQPVHDLSPFIVQCFNVSNIVAVAANITIWTHYSTLTADGALLEAQKERQKTETLLCNILPVTIVERLKSENSVIADSFESVTVLFADIVNFTQLAEKLPPYELVALLNQLFSLYDDLCENYQLEKIKTLGDAYMVAAGLPEPRQDHALAMASFALEMLKAVELVNASTSYSLKIRIGMHTGPVTAGVIGKQKFIYDLWGDTVNLASRMQSLGEADRIHMTKQTSDLLAECFDVEPRGKIAVKGKGEMATYWLNAAKPSHRALQKIS